MAGTEVATGELMEKTHTGSKPALNDLLGGEIKRIFKELDDMHSEYEADYFRTKCQFAR